MPPVANRDDVRMKLFHQIEAKKIVLTRKNVLVDPRLDLRNVVMSDADRVQKKQSVIVQASSSDLEIFIVVAVDRGRWNFSF